MNAEDPLRAFKGITMWFLIALVLDILIIICLIKK